MGWLIFQNLVMKAKTVTKTKLSLCPSCDGDFEVVGAETEATFRAFVFDNNSSSDPEPTPACDEGDFFLEERWRTPTGESDILSLRTNVL